MAETPTPPNLSDTRFAHRALVASAIFVALAFLGLFLWYSVYVIFLLFAGVLLAILLRTLADGVRQMTKLSHRWSLAIVLVVLLVALGLFWWLAASSLTSQLIALSKELPQAWEDVREKIIANPVGRMVLGEQVAATQPATTQSATQPATQPLVTAPAAGAGGGGGGGLGGGFPASELLGRFGGVFTTVMDLFAAIVVVFFTGLFLAMDPGLYVRGAIRLTPPSYRMRAGAILGAIGYTLRWWLVGQGITMLVVSIATWLGLLALGVPLALVLGIIAGLFNFIPNFGPLFSMVPATLLALTVGPGTAIGTVILFIVIQNLEGNVLTPLIQRKAVDLPPALGIIAQILLGILVGAVGLLLAWPLAAAVVLGVKMMYVEDVLGDEVPTPDDQPERKEVRKAEQEAREVENGTKKE